MQCSCEPASLIDTGNYTCIITNVVCPSNDLLMSKAQTTAAVMVSINYTKPPNGKIVLQN